MKLGYIREHNLQLNPHLTERFKFVEAACTRVINSKGDKVRCKLFYGSFDYEDVASTAKIMKENPKVILVREPFLLDDELREKCIKWVEWANKADPSEYDPFAKGVQ